MINWLENYAKTHLFYIILIIVGVVSFRCWLGEHDQRVQAENIAKQQEAHVADLQQQIVAVNQAASQKTQVVTKIVHDAVTPAQQIAAVPQLSNVELHARALPLLTPDGPPQVAVDLAPLVQELGQAREDSINLKACQDTSVLKDQQLVAKDVEIKALRKKPNFLHRITGVAKAVGVGIGIGLLIARKV